MSLTRPPAEKRLGNRARMAAAARERMERRVREAATGAAEAVRELADMHQAACDRLGVDIPLDPPTISYPLLLDVLELIEVTDGDRWLWTGGRNNKGLPVIRWAGGASERSVCRVLAEVFGLIGPEDYGTLYPADGHPEDINPWHRVLRRAPQPTGKADRYAEANAVRWSP